jgi:hypothetical protein
MNDYLQNEKDSNRRLTAKTQKAPRRTPRKFPLNKWLSPIYSIAGNNRTARMTQYSWGLSW